MAVAAAAAAWLLLLLAPPLADGHAPSECPVCSLDSLTCGANVQGPNNRLLTVDANITAALWHEPSTNMFRLSSPLHAPSFVISPNTDVETLVNALQGQVDVISAAVAANFDQPVKTTDAVTFATVDTGHGANELFPMDQGVLKTDHVTFATLNTGQGDNELYAMDQPVKTTSAVTFDTVNTGQGDNELFPMDQAVTTTTAVKFASVDTGYGANELHPMDQPVMTTSTVVFDTVDTGLGDNELYPMDQGVKTTDSVTFASINTGFGDNELYAMDQDVTTASAVRFASLDTGHGANSLYPMDQAVLTTSEVSFAKLTLGTLSIVPSSAGAYVTGDLFVKHVGAKIKSMSMQPLVLADTATELTFDAVDYDSHGFQSISANSLIVPVDLDGFYYATCQTSTADVTYTTLAIVVNGVDKARGDSNPAANPSGRAYPRVSDLLQLAAGDEITCNVQVAADTDVGDATLEDHMTSLSIFFAGRA